MTTLLQTRDPDVLVARDWLGGCALVFFVAGGLFAMIAVFLPTPQDGHDLPWYVGFLLGAVFIAIGLYRRVMRIDRATRRVETYRWCVVAFGHQSYNWDQFDRVEIGRELRPSKNSHVTVYPVQLIGPGVTVPISASAVDVEARRDAERLARFVQLPLHDRAEGTELVHKAEQLDESVGERAARLGVQTELPDPPPAMQTKVEVDAGVVRMTIPPPGIGLRKLVTCLSWVALGGWCLWLMWDPGAALDERDTGEWFITIAATVLIGIPLIVFAIGALVAAQWNQMLIDLSPKSVRVTNRLFGWKLSRNHLAEAIKDVLISGPSTIRSTTGKFARLRERATYRRLLTLRTDKRTYRFGEHLAPPEQDYLCRLIQAVLERG